jgi:hypothetical protein
MGPHLDDDPKLTTQATAKFLNVRPRTLEAWRAGPNPRGPKFIIYSRRCVRYQLSDLLAWLHDREVATGSDGEPR